MQGAAALNWYAALNGASGFAPSAGLGAPITSFYSASSGVAIAARSGYPSFWLGGQKTLCSPTPTQTTSQSPSVSQTLTATPTVTRTETQSQSPSQSPSQTASLSSTATRSGSGTGSSSGTRSATGTRSSSETPSASPTPSVTQTPSGTQSASSTLTPSATQTQSPSGTQTGSGTATRSQTPSATGTSTSTRSGTGTRTLTGSRSGTRTGTPSQSSSAAPTPSESPSATATGHPVQPVWSNARPFVPGGVSGADYGLLTGSAPPNSTALAAAVFLGVAWRFTEADPACGPGTYLLSEVRLAVSLAAAGPPSSAAVSFLVSLYANDPVSGLPLQPPLALTTSAAVVSAVTPAYATIPLPAPDFSLSSATSDPGATYTLAFLPSAPLRWAAPDDGGAPPHTPADGLGHVLSAVTSVDGTAWAAVGGAGLAFGGVEFSAAKTVCSPTPTQSPSLSWSSTASPSETQSASVSPSESATPSASGTPSATGSGSPSQTASVSLSPTSSATASQSQTRSTTASRTATATATGFPVQAVWDNTGAGALPVDAASYSLLAGGVAAGWLGVSWTFPEADVTCA